MKVRDLFTHYAIHVTLDGTSWRVVLTDADAHEALASRFDQLYEALELVELLGEILGDESPIVMNLTSRSQCENLAREHIARTISGELADQAEIIEEAATDERLRHWFEREMKK